MSAQRIHVLHLVYRFAAGGLENVIVQLVNGLPQDRFRHTVVALTTIDPAFRQRVQSPDVAFIALDKPPGQPFAMYPRFFQLLKRLRPDVFHSCNIAALEFAPVAAAAGVPLRVHAEHGWDMADPDGSNRKYQLLRRVYQRFVHRFVVVSAQIQDYLLQRVGVNPQRVALIANGVDTDVFRPRQDSDPLPVGFPFDPGSHRIIGTVGRLEPVKNQLLLVEAFIRLVFDPGVAHRDDLRLLIVGEGPLRAAMAQRLQEAALGDRVWMPGTRSDVPEVLRTLQLFVLPSLAEGTSCTLQEAMATALPIVATRVGGNADVLQQGALGVLVPSGDAEAMAEACKRCLQGMQRNAAGRAQAIACHSLQAVLQRYQSLFGGG